MHSMIFEFISPVLMVLCPCNNLLSGIITVCSHFDDGLWMWFATWPFKQLLNVDSVSLYMPI